VTGPNPTIPTDAYEQLRRHVLAGLPGGGRLGLAVVLRQGMAAWIEHGAYPLAPTGPTPVRESAAGASALPLNAGIVQILASIALGRIQEIHS
jgi:hypothetical protein